MKLMYALVVAGMAVSCSTSTQNAAEGETPENSGVKVLTVNEADWVDTDLSQVATLIPLSVKLPKDAVLTKNGNGGVDVTINDYYVITVSQPMVSDMPEMIEGAKSLTIKASYYEKVKMLVDEPNGFVYTYKAKDEGDAKYLPESHFFYGFETEGGGHFSFQDNQSLGTQLSGGDFPAETAKKVYEIIKQSARVL